MNINKILILFLTILFFQFQFQNLNAEDTNNLDDEELPAIDPFAGGVGNASQGSTDSTTSISGAYFLIVVSTPFFRVI